MRALAAMLLLVACSGNDRAEKQAECDKIAADIRESAKAHNIPAQGACSNANFPEGAADCERLRKCNAELDEL